MITPFKKWKPKKVRSIKSRKLLETKLKSKASIMVDVNRVPVIFIKIYNSLTPTIKEKRYFFSETLLRLIDYNLPFNTTLQLRNIDDHTPKLPYKSLNQYHIIAISLKSRLMIIEDCWRAKSLILTVYSNLDWGRLLYVNIISSILDNEVKRLDQLAKGAEWFDQYLINEGESGYPKHVGD